VFIFEGCLVLNQKSYAQLAFGYVSKNAYE